MTNKLSTKQVNKNQINWMIALAIIVAACLLFWFWYNQSYLKPSNVFWGTMSGDLSVDYVTRSSTKSEGPQKLTQVNDLQFTPVLLARSTVELKNTNTNEKVVTEAIGSSTTDFLRYVQITSNKSGSSDKSAVGQWAKRDAGNNEQPQVLADALLGSVLIFGNLNSSQSHQLITQMQETKAFEKYDLISKKTVNGNNVYSYNVSINLPAYGKVYSEYLKMIGQEKLAAQIGEQQPGSKFDFVLDINANSRVPSKLSVAGSKDYESFSNVGSGPRIIAPQTTLSIAELQAKLSGQ